MTTPERGSLDPTALALPPLTRFCLTGDYEYPTEDDPNGGCCDYADVEARERILREALDFQAALVKELLPYQEEAVRLLARIAELEAVCAGHYANTVEALRQANEADAKAIAFEADAARYRWLAAKAHRDTAYDLYGNGAHWSIGFFAADGRHALDAAIDAVRGAT